MLNVVKIQLCRSVLSVLVHKKKTNRANSSESQHHTIEMYASADGLPTISELTFDLAD